MRNIFCLAILACLMAVSCKSTGKKRTPSGYDYEVLKNGSGTGAQIGDYVSFSFDVISDLGDTLQTNNDPANLPTIKVPTKEEITKASPIIDILSGAKVGDQFILIMPIDSFPQKDPTMEKYKFIKYAVDVKEIVTQAKYEAKQDSMQKAIEAQGAIYRERLPEVEALAAKTLGEYKTKKLPLVTTASGLQYYIHEEGNGTPWKAGEKASVHYYGTTMDGKKFDDSFSRGQAIEFPVGQGQVIAGWDEALTTLKPGTVATLFIPYKLGYGETGSGPIGPKSDLVFYVELAPQTLK